MWQYPPRVLPYPSMELIVKSGSGYSYRIRVQATDTLLAVKKKIEDVIGNHIYPSGHLLLHHMKKNFLEGDDTTLAQHNVSNGDIVALYRNDNPCPLKGCPCKLEEDQDEEMVDLIEPKKEEERGDFKLKHHVRTKRNDLDDDLVVTQILSRLPAKSLMRFKSVHKGWKSTIEQDWHFVNLHRTHSQARPPCLLTIVPKRKSNAESVACFDLLSADLDCDVRGAVIRCSAMNFQAPSPDYKVLGPVRGLLCFVDFANFDVLIYNVSTRQAVTPWIRSSVSQKQLPLDKPECEFGFDPDTGEHKVIFVWHHRRPPLSYPHYRTWILAACEILTVGVDASWRTVDVVMPPCSIIRLKSISANGSIYWMYPNSEQYPGYSENLLAFDIGSEKFRTIKVPIFTLSRFIWYTLIELDGCLTIMREDSPEGDIRTLWTFHDRNKNGKSDSGSEDWTAVTITLPFYIHHRTVLFHSIPGKDQIILETDRRFPPGDFERACFYSYNRVNKTFSKFKIRGIPSLPKHHGCRSKFFVEDLFPAAEKKPVKNLS